MRERERERERERGAYRERDKVKCLIFFFRGFFMGRNMKRICNCYPRVKTLYFFFFEKNLIFFEKLLI